MHLPVHFPYLAHVATVFPASPPSPPTLNQRCHLFLAVLSTTSACDTHPSGGIPRRRRRIFDGLFWSHGGSDFSPQVKPLRPSFQVAVDSCSFVPRFSRTILWDSLSVSSETLHGFIPISTSSPCPYISILLLDPPITTDRLAECGYPLFPLPTPHPIFSPRSFLVHTYP